MARNYKRIIMPNWKTIPILPMYEASDSGQIRSKSRSVRVQNGKKSYKKVIQGKVLAVVTNILNGKLHYLSVPIQGKTYLVHRLIALTWLADNYFVGAEVNHKNGNKSDNRVSNLEWVTHQQNELHSYRVLGKGKRNNAK